MPDEYRGATAVAAAGAVAEAVGAVIIPPVGETLRVHSISIESDLAGALDAFVEVQESIVIPVVFAGIYRLRLVAAGSMEADNERFLCKGLNHQPPGGTAVPAPANQLQYRLVVIPGAAADVYSASMAGRTGRG